MKIYLFLFIVISTCCVFAQKVEVDKVMEDGSRVIITSKKDIHSLTDKFQISLSLDGLCSKQEVTFYTLNLDITGSHPLHIPDNSKLFLVLTDDSVIELTVNKEYKDEIGRYIGTAHYYSFQPNYQIEEKDIIQIAKGVKKYQ